MYSNCAIDHHHKKVSKIITTVPFLTTSDVKRMCFLACLIILLATRHYGEKQVSTAIYSQVHKHLDIDKFLVILPVSHNILEDITKPYVTSLVMLYQAVVFSS